MNSTKRVVISVILVFLTVVGGTAGYMLIEKWPLLDSLYMTVITLSTIGYGEVRPVSDVGRIYTMFLIFFGVGFALFAAGAVVQYMVEGQLRTVLGRRRLDNKIGRLKNHYIICGYGRIGRVLCQKLRGNPLGIVVIEKDPSLVPVMEEDGVLYLSGDASSETVLKRAGIERAKGLVSALATDMDNVFLVLTARQLSKTLYIIARASQEETKAKLIAAGADKVESPYDIGATNMAQRILRPTVTSFLDLALDQHKKTDIQMEEIPVAASSVLNNIMLKDSGIRQKYNLIIIAIKKPDGSMAFNPSFESVIQGGDTVIAVGEYQNLQALERELNPI
jgi:voltage-gated potassium channel